LGAGSTWPKSDNTIALATSSLGGSSVGRRAMEEVGGGRRRQRGKRTREESWEAKAAVAAMKTDRIGAGNTFLIS